MDTVKYTRTTLQKDYFDFYNEDDVLNVVDLGDKLVSPDNELLSKRDVVNDNYILHKPEDVVDVNDIDKYFIEIAWYDCQLSKWLSAVLVPETWRDVIKIQEICEGRNNLPEYKPYKYTELKTLYSLSSKKKENTQLNRWNTNDAKKSLENNSQYIYVIRGLNSGILSKHIFENMVHKNSLNNTSLTWISAWMLK